MRELKFRAWDAKAQTMLYFANPQMSYGDGQTKLVFGENFHDDFFEGTINAYLMQFTGLKDNKGQDIYEGDIVRATPYGQPDSDRVVIYAVVFSEYDGMWILKDERDIKQCPPLYPGIKSRVDQQLEVIGNMYGHPERLEGK